VNSVLRNSAIAEKLLAIRILKLNPSKWQAPKPAAS